MHSGYSFYRREEGKRGENLRIDNHDLPLLTMRPRRAENEHRFRIRNNHVERADVRLPVLEGNVSRVDAAVKGRARVVSRALRGGVVAVAELELDDVADSSLSHILAYLAEWT